MTEAVDHIRQILSATDWRPEGPHLKVLSDTLVNALAWMGREGHMDVLEDPEQIRQVLDREVRRDL